MGERPVGAPGVRGQTSALNRREVGQAAVELAAVLPVLLLLVVTAVDLGRAYYYYTQMANAVRVGAEFAVNEAVARPGSVDDRKTEIKNIIDGLCDPDPDTLDIVGDSMNPGDSAVIVATYRFEFITPLARTLVGGDGKLQLRYSVSITYT